MLIIISALLLIAVCKAWTFGGSIRKFALASSVGLGLGLQGMSTSAALAAEPASWNKDIMVETIKKPASSAAAPKAGDMVEIRFKGSYKGNVFDDTFKTDAPYYYRAGVGNILPGLDETVVNMKVGERLAVSFGGPLGFGEKGRPSAPGKPRIPPNAVIDYEVELVDLPGTAEDMIADIDE